MLISLQNLSFHFGARTILEGANWQVHTGERIGLVGPNGAGKSTVLRLMTGAYTPDGGSISKPKDVSLGFFNQDLLSFSTDNSILSVGMQAFERAKAIEGDMERILKDLESKPDDAKLLDNYSHALHDFEVAGGYEMEHRTAEVLEGLGFSTEDLQRSYNEFSGGWRMRVLLAKMMLQAPELLLLDEPTNHLDLPSIEWLERYLQGYPGSVIIVSHDRYFLDRMVTKIVEVFQRTLVSYSGNYSFFQKEKLERMELMQRAYENQQDYIRQQERFVERFKAKASKAAQAQSIVKRLDKLERIESPDSTVPVMNINFDVAVQPGKIISTLKNITKRFGKLSLLEAADAEIIRGDKIALIGANGKGKSTLLRIITGREPTDGGERKEGHNVEEAFYAQHQLESLNVEIEILEELKRSGSGMTEVQLRQLLGCFLFGGDDVFKKIRVLSGGEKARVALAKTIITKANFMLLDEPTNHLDMQSVEMLIEALNEYEGTLILVSHDRYFISQTANKIWWIEEGKIKEFVGTYEEWHTWMDERAAKQKAALSNVPPVAKEKPKEAPPVEKKAPDNESRARQKEYEKLQKKVERLEADVKKLGAEKSTLEGQLGDPSMYADKQKFSELDAKYRSQSSAWEKANKEYEKAFEELMELEEKLA